MSIQAVAEGRTFSRQTARPAGTGRKHYLPEPVYFDSPRFPVELADEVTLCTIARFADRYSFAIFNRPASRREGTLPPDPPARTGFVRELLAELRADRTGEPLCALLYRGRGLDDGPLLIDQHEGAPGILALTPGEFSALQDAWQGAGLPRDLYYPIERQHCRQEARETFGALVRKTVCYSPLQWADVELQSIPEPPTEEERKNIFLQSCAEFRRAVNARIAELSEAALPDRRQELLDLAGINLELAILELEEHGLSADHLRAMRPKLFRG